jgi:hypothetical protein
MKRLKKIESIVEKVLEMYIDARSNDDILYLYVCEEFCNGVSSMVLKEFVSIRSAINCPNFASVVRARRKVFEKRPELKPEKVTKLRKDMIDVYVDYAING